MPFRPHITTAMDRATSMTRRLGLVLAFSGIAQSVLVPAFILEHRIVIRIILAMTLTNTVPGVTLYFFARAMRQVELWAYVAAGATVVVFTPLILYSMILPAAGLFLLCGLDLVRFGVLLGTVAMLINCISDVRDCFRAKRREQMTRGFEPIMASPVQPSFAPPPPSNLHRK